MVYILRTKLASNVHSRCIILCMELLPYTMPRSKVVGWLSRNGYLEGYIWYYLLMLLREHVGWVAVIVPFKELSCIVYLPYLATDKRQRILKL